MNYSRTIYKKDTKDNIRFLTVTVAENSFSLWQDSGIVGTDKPITHRKPCKPKNVGKSNETSGNEQAVKEAEAIIKDKLTRGYFNTIKEAEDEEILLPMLAQDFNKYESKINWDEDIIYAQPKFDGMRCLKNKKVLESRAGKIIANMAHIEAELDIVDGILDGELYVHGEDFQTNMEYIKKYRPGLSENIKLHVYDMVFHNIPFEERFAILTAIMHSLKPKHIELVKTYRIKSKKELDDIHQKFLEEGYEGTMVRISKSGYGINKRSNELLKYKDFKDIACTIVEIGPAETMTNWGRPVVEWNGKRFACGTKMSHEAREDLLTNAHLYIGKTAEVRYFEEYNTGIPRFPVMVGIRLDK